MSTGLCAVLFAGVDWSHILVAALAQHFFSYLYYGALIDKLWVRLHARDKGVRDIEAIVVRYSMLKSVFISFAASVARALFIVATLNLLQLRRDAKCQMCAFLDAGLLVSAVSLIGYHNELWGQRALLIQLLDVSGDTLSALIGAFVLYYFSA